MKLKGKDRLVISALLGLFMLCVVALLVMLRYDNAPGELPGLSPSPSPVVTPIPSPTPSPSPSPSPTPSPTPTPIPELLRLVNPWTRLPEGYAPPEPADIGEEMTVDSRCYEDLMAMLEDCRAAGNAPYVCSAYRDLEKQQFLYNNKIRRLVLEGTDPAEAPEIAAMSVALPNTSEHQLGLAVDIIDWYYTNLDAGQEDTSTQQWLMENCWDYGFILRYPNGTSEITGIIYEPWHYRYVGREAALEIRDLGITLEEYIQLRYQ